MSRISVFELLSKSSKNMGAVNSRVHDYALELIKRSYHEGINVLITSGYRSNAEQERLYAQGRTTAGQKVTNARAGQSIHNFGYAIDFVVTDQNGAPVWTVDKKWRRVAQIGKSLGMSWGGDWSSFVDYPHLDFQKGMPLSQFRAGKRPTIRELPERDYLGIGDTGNKVRTLQENLNKVGYNVSVDGVYGDEVETAVMKLQFKFKLDDDGLYGKMTNKLLLEMLKVEKPKEPVKPVSKPVEKPKPKAQWEIDYEKDLKGAIDMGFIDGTRLQDAPTREEMGVVAYRIYKAKK